MALNMTNILDLAVDVIELNTQYYFPDFLNTEEKYNAVIRATDTVEKFQKVLILFAEDENMSPNRVLSLTSSFERDLVLVHNKKEFAFFQIAVKAVIDSIKCEFEVGN